MNKEDLVQLVHEMAGGSKAQASEIVDRIFGSIIESVAKGNECSIAGFGIFEARKRAARKGRNPQTGETINIAASTAPKFRAGKAFKDRVNK